jgi:hypothetical protein
MWKLNIKWGSHWTSGISNLQAPYKNSTRKRTNLTSAWLQNITNLKENPWQKQLPRKNNLYTWRWPIRMKHVVYAYSKETNCEHQLKLHIDGKSVTKCQIYTVQQDVVIINIKNLRAGTCK